MPALDFDNPDLLQQLQQEAHVWMTRPEEVTGQHRVQNCLSRLSEDEQQRYHRFHFDNDRHHFLVAHALLRTALSAYADVAPADWVFSHNQYGRPEIAGPENVPALRFNLSHTNGLVACVVTRELDCGIDVEQVIPRGDPAAIARKMFAASEQQVLEELTGDDYLEQFFNYWTLREAYCKALGVGIAHSNRDYYFEEQGANRWAINFETASDDAWQLALDRPVKGHVLALAIRTAAAPPRKVVQGFVTP